MDLIVAVDQKWGIGCQGQLLVYSKRDMAWFREKTAHSILLYGRKTLSSFPAQKPLPNRKNIILSRTMDPVMAGAQVICHPAELLDCIESDQWDDVMVIGGGSVYRLLLPFCRTAWVTVFDGSYEFDQDFPNLDADPAWTLAWQSDEEVDETVDVHLHFRRYEQAQPMPMQALLSL